MNPFHRKSEIRNRKSPAFTLVELLVVITIIGILIALLLPAVQAARDAARRMQCQNNLKQIALAVHGYAEANGTLPIGSLEYGSQWDNYWNHRVNWAIAILPYLEQQGLYDQYDMNKQNNDPVNLPVLRKSLAVMTCPVDPSAGQLLVPTQGGFSEPGIATGSYKAVSGKRWRATGGWYWDYPPWWATPDRTPNTRGPMYMVMASPTSATMRSIGPARFADITDGTSNSLLAGEAMTVESKQSKAEGAVFWASTHSYHNEGSPQPESWCRHTDYDTCMTVTGDMHQYCDRCYGSLHSGNIMNFSLCDGSVRALSMDIDGSLFEALGTIAGGELAQAP